MARFLFATFDGGGCMVAAVALAQALTARGHEAAFLGYERQRQAVEAQGFAFVRYARSGDYDRYTDARPIEERLATVLAKIWANPEHVEDLRDELTRWPPDALIADFLLLGVLAGAEAIGVPTAVLVSTLYEIPVTLTDPGYPLSGAIVSAADAVRAKVGLAPLGYSPAFWTNHGVVLVTALHELDRAADPLPANVRHIGPVFEQHHTAGVLDLALDGEETRPLVLVSFSTVPQPDQATVLQRVLDALGKLPVNVLLTTGTAVDPAALSAPANATVRRFVPHGSVLPRASLLITHGGHGTVMAALAHGLPLVVMPFGGDQRFIAAMAEREGFGRSLSLAATPEEIGAAVAEVLGSPTYRDAAGRFQPLISPHGGAEAGADELERLAAPTRPIR